MAFSLSTTTLRPTLAFPKVSTTTGVHLTTRKNGRITAQSSSNDDGGSVKLKYEKALKDVEILGTNYVTARKKKRIDNRVEMWKADFMLRKEAWLVWREWEKKKEQVTTLQKHLGIAVPSENGAFLSLKEKMKEVLSEVMPTRVKYLEEWEQRVKISTSDETVEEMLAWEIHENKLLEYIELQVQMYNLRPGMDFGGPQRLIKP